MKGDSANTQDVELLAQDNGRRRNRAMEECFLTVCGERPYL